MANVFAIFSGGLYFFQENLIFHPKQLPQNFSFQFELEFEEIWIAGSDGAQLHGLHFPALEAQGTLLYFHGNAGSLERWGTIVQYFVKQQYNVIVMDYRQFGKSTGRLTESFLYEDSLEWYTYATNTYPDLPITAYGRSLGTTFATYVASQQHVKQLVLETPFYSIQDEARSRFPFLPVKRLLHYNFPTYQFINDVEAPIVIFHGTEDAVVHYAHGKRLFEHITQEQKKFVTIPEGGHNNLIESEVYRNAVKAIL